MKKYKLIKEYPGSPELGEVVKKVDSSTFYFYEKPDLCRIVIRKTLVDNQPEYWEEVNDIYYMVSLTDMPFHNAWEPIRVEAIALDTDTKKYFSTEEGAKSFILLHKPCLSLYDIKEHIKSGNKAREILSNIYHIVKSKL